MAGCISPEKSELTTDVAPAEPTEVVSMALASNTWWRKTMDGNVVVPSAWTQRRPLTITAIGAAVPEGYTMNLNVDNNTANAIHAKSRGDLEDIRIVRYIAASDAWVELDREVNFQSNGMLTVRFKVQSEIASGTSDTTYWLYYGNMTGRRAPKRAFGIYDFGERFDETWQGEEPAGFTITNASPQIWVERTASGSELGNGLLLNNSGETVSMITKYESAPIQDLRMNVRVKGTYAYIHAGMIRWNKSTTHQRRYTTMLIVGNPGTLSVRKYCNGLSTVELGSKTINENITTGVTYPVTVEAKGNQIQATYKTTVLTVTDDGKCGSTSIPLSGGIGLAGQMHWSDVTIEKVITSLPTGSVGAEEAQS